MGGSSSKEKKSISKQRGSNSTINTINTIDDDCCSDGKKHKKDKKKSPKKGSTKINKKTKNHSDCDKNKHGSCDKTHNTNKCISFEAKTTCGVEGTSRVYRKKSACPSCDARDMIMDQVRSRSGSDKSLRYSDFNRIVRQSRVGYLDECPIEIPLDGVGEPLPETICFICGVYTGCVTRTCRVCHHVYHTGCLQKIGQGLDAKSVRLAQLGIWSCHQCADISRLLTREETHTASAWLDELGIDQDGVKENDYVFYKEKLFEAHAKPVTPERRSAWIEEFRCATKSNDQPVLDWSQFLEIEAVIVLQNRCKESLVHLLTDSEFGTARKMYKEIDQSGQVTVSDVKNTITNLHNKFTNNDHRDEDIVIKEEEEEDMTRCVTWSEFLRMLAIHMLSVRKNCQCFPTMDKGRGETCSVDSVDDEDYRTCESDADKIELSEDRTLDDSKDADKSVSMLDDLSKAFNLDCGAPHENSHEHSVETSYDIQENVSEAAKDSAEKRHLRENRPYLHRHPNFTTVTDEPETRPAPLEKMVNRRSEILVRPSTEEGRSPRRAISQKLVSPGYGLVDKIQNSDWVC